MKQLKEPFNVPEDWSLVSLDEVLDVLYRYPSYYDIDYIDNPSTGVMEIRGKMISETGNIETDEARYITEETHKEYSKTQLEYGDVLLSVRGTVGKVALYDLDGEANMVANLIRLSPDNDIILSKYLFQFMKSHLFQNQLVKFSGGTTVNTITSTDLKKIIIPLPNKEEQERIVSLLSDVDEYIEKTSERVHALEQQKQAVLQQVFGDNEEVFKGIDGERISPASWSRFEVPSDWRLFEAEDLFSLQSGNNFSSEDMNSSGKGYPLIKIGSVENMTVSDYIDNSFDSRYIVNNGDYVIKMSGAGEFRCKKWNGKKSALNQRVCKLDEILVEDVLYDYVGILLDIIVQQIDESLTGTTFSNMSQNDIYNSRIPVPPIEKQEEIVSILSDIESSLNSTQDDLSSMRELKKGLLQEIFSG